MIDRELLALLGTEKIYIYFSVMLMLLGMTANLSLTGCICYALWLLMHEGEATSYLMPCLAAILSLIIRYICTCSVADVKDNLGRRVKKNLREKVYDKVLALGGCSHGNLGMAGLTQVSLEGIEQLDLYYSQYIPQFLFALLAPPLLFTTTVWIDWKVALTLLCCVPLIPVSILLVSKYAKKIFVKYWSRYTSMGDKFLDSIQGMRELKIFQADRSMHEKMDKNSEDFRRITMKVLTMQLASTTVMDFIAYGGAGAGVAMSVWAVVHQGLEPTAALFLILTAAEFFLPLRAFGSSFHVAMNGASAGWKILDLLALPEPYWGNKVPGNSGSRTKDSEIKDVTFSYDGIRNVLRNVNMKFPVKGITAIIGKSGCGKSTVVRLLQGTSRASIGDITLGGIAIHDVSRSEHYKHLSIVSCNSYIFNQTIRDNFKMAKSDVTEQEIYQSLSKVNLDGFIRERGGLDRMIAEDASNLSGGQKQRLALAINIVADKEIYVFDEATSNIDIESEEIIMDTIKALGKTKCVIIISHRLANIVDADNIYYMENGEVKEEGSHKDLMLNGRGYSELFVAQEKLEKGECHEWN